MEEIELKSAISFEGIKIWNFSKTKFIIVNDNFINRFEALSQHDVIKNEVAVCDNCNGLGGVTLTDKCEWCNGTGKQTVL